MGTKTKIIKKVAKYKDLKFENVDKLNTWLLEMSKYTIELKDNGQDLLTIYVAENGEILHTDAQSHLYIGKFINVDQLNPSHPLKLWEKSKWKIMNGLVVKSFKLKL